MINFVVFVLLQLEAKYQVSLLLKLKPLLRVNHSM